MLSKVLHGSIRFSFLPFSSLLGKHPDDVSISQLNIDPNELKEETGWDRVKKMYTVDEFGMVSPEFNSILQVGMVSVFFGGMYGGLKYSKHAYTDFMVNNTATSFKSHFEAKRKMQDHITVNFAKGAFRWSWRIAFFSMSLMAITTTIQVYRNKYGIAEFATAGAITGSLFKFNMGPKGLLAGGVIGSCLGCFCGALTVGLLKLTGISMQEAHMWRHQISHSRSKLRKMTVDKDNEEKDYAIIKLHDDKIGEAGHTIEAIKVSKSTS